MLVIINSRQPRPSPDHLICSSVLLTTSKSLPPSRAILKTLFGLLDIFTWCLPDIHTLISLVIPHPGTLLTGVFSSLKKILTLGFQVFVYWALFACKPLLFWITWRIVSFQSRRHLPCLSKGFNGYDMVLPSHVSLLHWEPHVSNRGCTFSLGFRVERHEEQNHRQPTAEMQNDCRKPLRFGGCFIVYPNLGKTDQKGNI